MRSFCQTEAPRGTLTVPATSEGQNGAVAVVGRPGMRGKRKVNGKTKIPLCAVDGVAGISVPDDADLLRPLGQRRVVALAGIDPARSVRRLLFLPERGLGLEVIHDEFAGGKGFAAMR